MYYFIDDFTYSSLKASIGFTLVALFAGINPINVPKTQESPSAKNTTGIDTDAFINSASGP